MSYHVLAIGFVQVDFMVTGTMDTKELADDGDPKGR